MGLIVGCAVLASGESRRFGGNKLLHPLGGRPLICGALDAAPADMPRLLVTRYEEVAALGQAMGFEAIVHDYQDLAMSVGLAARRAIRWDGAIFLVGDQPLIGRDALLQMRQVFAADPTRIVRAARGHTVGNPVLFPKALIPELTHLPPGRGGGYVAAAHQHLWTLLQVPEEQLWDVDTLTDLDRFRDM